MSEIKNVPDEAIDAAAIALWNHGSNTGTWRWGEIKEETREVFRSKAKAALQAAAPLIILTAKASALRSAANDPAMRLSGHSGVSVRKLHTRANTLTEGLTS